MSEQWKRVEAAPDYHVSDIGRVRSHKGLLPRVLRPCVNPKSGYHQHTLFVDGRPTFTTAHVLVLAAFVGPRPKGLDVRHIDGDPSNNRLENLTYGTRAENMQDKRRHGTNTNLNKTHCPAGHAYTTDNTYVAPDGARHCRACQAEATRRHRAKKKAAAA